MYRDDNEWGRDSVGAEVNGGIVSAVFGGGWWLRP